MRRSQPTKPPGRHGASINNPRPRRSEYSTRSAAAIVIAITALAIAFGARAVSLDPSAHLAGPTPMGTTIAMVDPTATSTISFVPATNAPTATTAPTLSPTTIPTEPPTLEPTSTPTEEMHPTVPPSGNDSESVVFERGNPNKKLIAFTFDAGEGPGYVSEILDLFAKYGIHGSFGVTGQWAEQNPDLVKRMVDEGHLVFNHTENHKSFTGFSPGTAPLTDQERSDEITQANDAIEEASGVTTKPLFRFPYNDYDEQSLILLKQLGYDYTLGYTCDTQAWNGKTADEIIQHCGPDSPDGGPGGIILMHVVQEQDFLALEPLIGAYLAAGYEIVTMDVMIGS
ncbi:MAG: polysaccharide deacetylase family protein [Thermomicrobiales bacterium]